MRTWDGTHMQLTHLIDNIEADGVTLLEPHERTVLAIYTAAVDDYASVFDVIEAGYFREVEAEHGTEIAREHARGHFATLDAWYQELDSLYTDLATGPGQTHSEAARHILQREANRFFHVLNLLRREVCTWLLGTAGPRPEIDAGVLTFCDIPPRIHLDGTALAESD
ncbi:hypothetical protein [Embleya sp. NPDC020630]|uniref:hypothetical protein n=1 Tax=Embleya sp. NPDC020630 TaxID=3363979 RepID=UPI0037B500EB